MFHLSIHLDEQLAPPPADDDSDALIGLQWLKADRENICTAEIGSFLELPGELLLLGDSG